MTERVGEYLEFKKTVNVEINYVTNIEFPAVTICNENQFRSVISTTYQNLHLIVFQDKCIEWKKHKYKMLCG